jgi:hypothetical protein
MNRLAPLIIRQAGAYAPELLLTPDLVERQASSALEDLKLFATGWLGGLVFFGTLLA